MLREKWGGGIVLAALLALAGCQYNGVVMADGAQTIAVTNEGTTQDRGRQSTDVAREAEVGLTEPLTP